MTEAEALLKIAEAIEHLASAIIAVGSGAGAWLFLFFFFKNLGTSTDALNGLGDKISFAIKKLKEE